MQYSIDPANQDVIRPMTVSITLETPDDVRWFYHLMNFQEKEIRAGYAASSKGSFDERFVPFTAPDKKELFKAVKNHAAMNDVAL
jgi:hypothetical protein